MAVVAMLVLSGVGAWHFGRQFSAGLAHERATTAPSEVPSVDLAALSGQTRAEEASVPVKLVNTTTWHLTSLTLAVETIDRKRPLTTMITQTFSETPWAPGDAIERGIALAANWNGRAVRYMVVSAEGFR